MMLVISPHLDDAVLSCGALLAAHRGAVVATVFAGVPRDPRQRTEWDARSGFADAAEALAARRAEDAAALAELGAAPRWLDFRDDQYGDPERVDELAAALGAVFDEVPDAPVLVPMGLFHRDHRRAHDAAMLALDARPPRERLLYEDVPYRAIPGVLQARLAQWRCRGLVAAPAPACDPACACGGRGDDAAKARALACYRSQLRAYGPGGVPDATQPERLWRLVSREDST